MEQIHFTTIEEDKNRNVLFFKLFMIIISILTLSFRSECQELLHSKKDYVNKYIIEKNGKLIYQRFTLDIGTNTKCDMYIYEFSATETNKSGLYLATFFFSKEGKCIHYLYRYCGYGSMSSFVNKSNDTSSGFKNGSNNTEWVSKNNNNIIISITKDIAFSKPPNFEINYIERPKDYVPYKSKTEEELKKIFSGIKNQP